MLTSTILGIPIRAHAITAGALEMLMVVCCKVLINAGH